jgi:hypothetical protein
MSNAENYPEKLVPHVLDSEWLAMSMEEQEQADSDRYFKTGWNETLFDVKQEVAKERARIKDSDIRNIALRGMSMRRHKTKRE